MAAASFRVSWNRFPSHVLSALDNLRLDEDFVDVSIYCGRQLIKAHRNVLSASSDYFKEIFKANPSSHPVVILCDVDHASLRSLVDFMYHGEIEVPTARLDELLRLGEMLQVQGISSHQGLTVEDPGGAAPKPDLEPPLPPGDVITPECVISEPGGTPGRRRRRSRRRTSSAGEEASSSAAAGHVTPDGAHGLLAGNGHVTPTAAQAPAHGSSLGCGSNLGSGPSDASVQPTTIGHSLPPPVGHSLPPPVGHGLPPPVGHGLPPPVGHGLPPPVGHGLPPPVGHGLSPPMEHGLPPPMGHGLPPPAAHSMSTVGPPAPPLPPPELPPAPSGAEPGQPTDGGPLSQLRVKTEWPEEATREPPPPDAADSKLLLDDTEQSGLDMSQYSGGIFAGGMGSRRPLTGAERARRYRERKKLKKLYEALLGGSPRREQLTVQL